MSGLVRLPEELTVKTVEDVKQLLDGALEVGEPTTIDASGLGRIDGLGIQLLLAYSREMQVRDVELLWHDPGENLINICVELGVRELPFGAADRVATSADA